MNGLEPKPRFGPGGKGNSEMTYFHLPISYLTIKEKVGRSWSTEFYRSIYVFRTAANKRYSIFWQTKYSASQD